MSIIICVPTYNEEGAIKQMIKLLRDKKLDFIICDGFSTDNTVAIAKEEQAECVYRTSPGKGSAIVKGLEIAAQRNYKYMGVIDCDLTYDINDLVQLYNIAANNNYDLVVGGRPFKKIAWHRRVVNYLISFYFNALFRAGIKDILSGLRILKTEKYSAKINAVSFDFEPRSIAFAVKNKLAFAQFPINYTERVGESKADIKELMLILWGITQERLNA
jgi:glycosyltransferase involved in cell wall biosynthesis